MTRTKNNGLPDGVYAHGKKFRCRIAVSPSPVQRWAPVFEDPIKCHLYYLAAQKAHAEGQPPPARRGDDIVDVRVTFWSLMTGEFRDLLRREAPAESTTKARERLLDRHLKPAAWVHEPVEQITRVFLERWLDARLDRTQPAPTPTETYDWASELSVLPEISRPQLGVLLRLIRRCFGYAMTSKLAPLTVNPADMVSLRRPDKIVQGEVQRERALGSITQTLDIGNLLAIARFLDWMDLIPLWLCYLCGLRISETFGLRIGDWDPLDRRLWVEVQHGTFTLADGSLLRHRPWVKSPTSMRYLYVCSSLAAALDRYIAAVHGPAPDPAAPLCVGRSGPDATQAPHTWRLQFKAAITRQQLTVNVRRHGEPLPQEATPHSLRGAISAVLEEAGVTESARSFYLGHKLPGSINGSRVTAEFYSKPSDSALRRIAEVVEKHVADLGVELLPEESDDYLTVKEAAHQLGVSPAYIYERISAGVLTSYGNQPRRTPGLPGPKRGPRRVSLVLRADIDAIKGQLRPPPDVALPATEVATRLGLKLHRVLLLSRAEKGYELRRWTGSPATLATGDIFIDTVSVERFRQQQQRIAAGELVTPTTAERTLGLSFEWFARISDTDLPVEIHNNRRYYRVEDVKALTSVSQPPNTLRLALAAAKLKLPVTEFLLLAGAELADLTPADGHRWIPQDVVERVAAARQRQTAQANRQARDVAKRNPVLPAAAPPDPAVWLDLVSAGQRLGLTERTVDARFAGRGLQRCSYAGVRYVRRVDVAAEQERLCPAGWLTLRQAATRMGVGMSAVSRHVTRGTVALMRRHQDGLWRTFVSEADVDALRAAQEVREDDDLLGVGDAAALIGCTLPALYRAVGEGSLPLAAGGIENIQQRRAARIRSADALAFKHKRTPPDGWLSVAELRAKAHELGLEVPGHLTWQLRHGHFPLARKYDRPVGWRLPPETVDMFAPPAWLGLPNLSELLAENNVVLTASRRAQLTRALKRGVVEGAILANRRAGWRFPPDAVPALLALARELQEQRNAE